jgi:hypothetical protein
MGGIKDGFWGKVSVGHPGGCWGWIGATDPFGYGQVWSEGRVQAAHRVAWRLVKGPIPSGSLVLHHCDNPPCSNPDHLFLGTQKDNMMDAASKGRIATNPKLTVEQAMAIRSSTGRGVDLAGEHGVSQALVSMIRSGKRRPYLQEV